CQVVRAAAARRIVLATPVLPASSLATLAQVADQVVAVLAPASFYAIGEWYDDFSQTTDEEVVDLLERVHGER
ncbi:MAG: phosphoribosyltransferase, partial [Acidimicrobiales bacterium]